MHFPINSGNHVSVLCEAELLLMPQTAKRQTGIFDKASICTRTLLGLLVRENEVPGGFHDLCRCEKETSSLG